MGNNFKFEGIILIIYNQSFVPQINLIFFSFFASILNIFSEKKNFLEAFLSDLTNFNRVSNPELWKFFNLFAKPYNLLLLKDLKKSTKNSSSILEHPQSFQQTTQINHNILTISNFSKKSFTFQLRDIFSTKFPAWNPRVFRDPKTLQNPTISSIMTPNKRFSFFLAIRAVKWIVVTFLKWEN